MNTLHTYIFVYKDWFSNNDAAWKKDPQDTTRLHLKIVKWYNRSNSELLHRSREFNANFLPIQASSVHKDTKYLK